MGEKEVAVDQAVDDGGNDKERSEEEELMAKLKEAITVEREDLGSLRARLTITVPQDTVDERMGHEFAELKREAQVPGFRKGHAPLALVEKRFRSDVGDQLKSRLIGSGYLAATEKEDLKVLGDPLFSVKVKEKRGGDDGEPQSVEMEKLLPLDKALEVIELPKEGALTFTCEVELKPEFELPELTKIPLKKPDVSVDDEDVEAELKRMRMSRGTFVPVEKGAIKEDDLLYGAVTMTVEGRNVYQEENYDFAARDLPVLGVPLEGLGDLLIGKEIGADVTIEADVPNDHEIVDIRGKKAKFEFTINEIKRLEVPPLDKEFVSSLGFESEKELRKTFRDAMTSRLDESLQKGLREQVGTYLIDKTLLEIPEGLSQRQTERSVTRRMVNLYRAGVPEAEIKKSVDEMQVKAHEQVVRDLKLYFILEKIAEDRDIDVPEERLNAAIAQMAQRANKRFDRVRDELSKGDGLTTLFLQLRDERVLDALVADADITEDVGPKKKSTKKAPKKKVKKTTKKKTS